jgi:hypothetical protein
MSIIKQIRYARVKEATTARGGFVQYGSSTEVAAGTRTDRAVAVDALETRLDTKFAEEGVIQYADISLTNANIIALRATPISMVAAQGAGTVILFRGALLKLVYGGTNVFTESADNLAIRVTDGSGAIVSQSIESTGFIDQSATTYSSAEPKVDAIIVGSAAENKALVLHNTGDGEIAGNAGADNTMEVRVFYQVVSI